MLVDSNADDTIVAPETQKVNSHSVQNDVIEDRNCCTETSVIEDSQTPWMTNRLVIY